ncbi:MAG: HNH endonuclease, partial [Bacteroidetes bacterium]|nr:HNH endonuclease [Bacteroidota bacterium]
WTPQSSGIEIHTEFVDHLEQTWFDFIGSQKELNKSDVSLKENDIAVFAEGGPNQIMVTKYERNPYARKACIEHYGPSCFVCGFNFYDHYGKIGEDFIHVHHLFQLSKVGEDSLIDPIKDLRPVCPNCHAMIHKRKEAYSIDEIKALIKDKSI